jgi:type IV pilus assembly protein PilV
MNSNLSKFRASRVQLAKQLMVNKYQGGAILLEAMIAILIFSFGILAISGLQGAMVKNTTDSNYRAEASYIVQQQVGRMWANPANINSFLTTTTLNRLPSGQLTVSRTVGNRYSFLVTWQTPGDVPHNFQANASIEFNP